MKPRLNLKRYIAVLFLFGGIMGAATLFRTQTAQGTLPPGGAGVFQAPDSYEEQSPLPGARVWKGKDSSGSTIVLLEKQMTNVEAPPAEDEALKARLEGGQKLPHLLAGIKNFKIEKIERAKIENGSKIVLTGSYSNSNDETIRFEKWEYFLKTGYSQIAYSARESDSFPSREKISQLLKGYIPFGI